MQCGARELLQLAERTLLQHQHNKHRLASTSHNNHRHHERTRGTRAWLGCPRGMTSFMVAGSAATNHKQASIVAQNPPRDEANPFPPRAGFWAIQGTFPSDPIEPLVRQLLARKKKPAPSAATPGKDKDELYQDERYPSCLEWKNSFMSESRLDVCTGEKHSIDMLLDNEQALPQDVLVLDDPFEPTTCQRLRNKTEAHIMLEIARLVVPSAESLAAAGAKHLEILKESLYEDWNSAIPLFKARPQPDYSVGFAKEAFTDEQRRKLWPFLGDLVTDESLFLATDYMHFPFLTVETGDLEVADRKNAHSMTLALRGLTALFRAVSREDEIHRQILAWSFSHDHQRVRIYGHYPVILGDYIKYNRHPVGEFHFTADDGKDKWAAYQFTKNLYDMWVPIHLERISLALDLLPQLVWRTAPIY